MGATAVGMVTRAVSLIVDQVFLAPGYALDLTWQVEELYKIYYVYWWRQTLPVFASMTQRETVTLTVLFIKPAFVTTPKKEMGGMVVVRGVAEVRRCRRSAR